MVRPLRPAPVAFNSGDPGRYFKVKCATCHGASGQGNGPRAKELSATPQSFVDVDWQATVDDEEISTAISDGGPAVSKSPVMPAHPELKEKPEMLEDLVHMVRRFRRSPRER